MSFLNNLCHEINNIPRAMKKDSPLLLTVAGIIGIGATVYSAVKATPLAIEKMDQKILDIYDEGEDVDVDAIMSTTKESMQYRFDILGPKEVVKSCWKCYVPSVLVGGLTVASFISSYKVSTRRLTTMTAAYELTRTAYDNYRRNVVKEIGAKKDEKIRTKVAQEQADKKISDETMLGLPEGKNVCLDLFTGNVFYSTREDILAGVSAVKDKFLSGEQDVSLNEFYDEIDAQHIGVGDTLGFTPDSNIDVMFGSVLRGNTPILTIDYYAAPRFDYRDLL